MVEATTRRASGASDCSLDPAYVADDAEYCGHRKDWAASRSVSPPKQLSDEEGRAIAPIASPSVPVIPEATYKRLDREDLLNLDTLEETAKGNNVPNPLRCDAYKAIVDIAKTPHGGGDVDIARTPHGGGELALARRVRAVKSSFELYYMFVWDDNLAPLIELLDEEEGEVLTQVYNVLHHVLYFCPLSSSSTKLTNIKDRLIPLLPLTLSTSPTSTSPLPTAISSFASSFLKKAPQLLIPDLFSPQNIETHRSLIWLSDKYSEITNPATKSGPKVKKEIDAEWQLRMRGLNADLGVNPGRPARDITLATAEKIAAWWTSWMTEGAASAGKIEALNKWLSGPEAARASGNRESPPPAQRKRVSALPSPPPLPMPDPKRRRLSGERGGIAPRRGYLGKNYEPGYRGRRGWWGGRRY